MIKALHENYSRDETVIGGSDRSFGIVMTFVFAVMSLLNWWHDGPSWRWTGGIAVLFLAATLLYPAALKPLNRLWLKFGLLLHKVVNPIVMALVFFGTVLPPHHAGLREGPVAAQAAARREQLLDRSVPTWARPQIHERSVLRGSNGFPD